MYKKTHSRTHELLSEEFFQPPSLLLAHSLFVRSLLLVWTMSEKVVAILHRICRIAFKASQRQQKQRRCSVQNSRAHEHMGKMYDQLNYNLIRLPLPSLRRASIVQCWWWRDRWFCCWHGCAYTIPIANTWVYISCVISQVMHAKYNLYKCLVFEFFLCWILLFFACLLAVCSVVIVILTTFNAILMVSIACKWTHT